ncbi:unnamed protein product [Linum trigynum]|uniref:Uncharacterized protein n=1 Tax=Linum trigynum TaxID=586398 RepID=A0AAV2E712_9ROSI
MPHYELEVSEEATESGVRVNKLQPWRQSLGTLEHRVKQVAADKEPTGNNQDSNIVHGLPRAQPFPPLVLGIITVVAGDTATFVDAHPSTGELALALAPTTTIVPRAASPTTTITPNVDELASFDPAADLDSTKLETTDIHSRITSPSSYEFAL